MDPNPEAKWIRELPQEVKDPLVPQMQLRRTGCLRAEKVMRRCYHYPWSRAEENFDVQVLSRDRLDDGVL